MRDICALKRSYVWKWLAKFSDAAASEKLRAEAARYHSEAAEIETGVRASEAKAAPDES